MAIVETLEVRFVAKLGKLGAQIGQITGALHGFGGASASAMRAVSETTFTARRAIDGLGLSTDAAASMQGKLASRLKKTGRALKNVSKEAKKAAGSIGLHKMDEVNLVGKDAKSGSGGGSSGGSGGASTGGSQADLSGLRKMIKLLSELDGFFERFHGNIRRSMKSVDTWLSKATGGLAGKLPKLLGSAGKNAALSLAEGLKNTFGSKGPELVGRGKALLQSIGEGLKNGAAFSTAPSQAASTLTEKLRMGILGGQEGARSAASTVAQAAKFSSQSASDQARSAGANLSKGLANGMLSYIKKVRDAAARLAKAALEKLRTLLRIASPSKLTFKMGGFFGEGFADGIRASVHPVQQSARILAQGAAVQLGSGVSFSGASNLQGMMHAAVNEALGNTNIVIPLNVDGIKLGEASIRGINRVTRASGRLMLEI